MDRDGAKGKYILCGSYTIPKNEESKILHSGIGRIAPLELHPMSLYESEDSSGEVSLSGMFDGDTIDCVPKDVSLRDIVHLVARGGWPSNLWNDVNYELANEAYLNALCQSDTTGIDGVRRDPRRMMMLIRALARNEATVASGATIRKDMKRFDDETISESSFEDYMDILSRLNMVWEQPAYDPNIRSPIRVGKRPKRHLADPSLAFSALRLSTESAIADLNTFRFLFESMCERDLMIYAETNGGTIHHYRDDRGNEIDAIVEMHDGRWGMFNVRLGFYQVEEAAENLVKMSRMFEEKGAKRPSVLCVVCGVCKFAYRREDGVYVVPITMLRD